MGRKRPNNPVRETVKIVKAIKREQAIASGDLAGYRMVGKTVPARKGKGSYKRKNKHKGAW